MPRGPQAISALLQETHLCDEEVELTCMECARRVRATRRVAVAKFPAVLVVHLQRAILGHGGAGAARRRALVTSRLVLPVRAPGGALLRVEMYALRAVVHHRGTPGTRNSHFTAAVAQAPDGVRRGLGGGADRWWIVDDDRVGATDVAGACDSAHAYLAVYERGRSIRASEWKTGVVSDG